MVELDQTKFHKVADIFKGIPHNVPLVRGILEQTVEGRVFVDDEVEPAVALVMFNDIFFIGGDHDNQIAADTLYPLLYEDIILNSREEYFDFYTFSDHWVKKLERLLAGKIVDKRCRRNFRITNDRLHNKRWKETIPKDCALREINDSLIVELDLDKGFWSAESKRFGFYLIRDKQIVSECIAVFVGGGQCEISVATNNEHQRKGYAFLASSAFIDRALSMGINLNWACWEDRESSASLAKKLGYEEIEKCPVLIMGK